MKEKKTNIETLKVTKQVIETYSNVTRGAEVFFEILSEALEKQIPKKPYRHPETQPKHFLNGVDGYYCPVCDRDVLDKDNDCFMYCPDCGQALDWSEEE